MAPIFNIIQKALSTRTDENKNEYTATKSCPLHKLMITCKQLTNTILPRRTPLPTPRITLNNRISLNSQMLHRRIYNFFFLSRQLTIVW